MSLSAHRQLWDAFTLPLPEATDAWRNWRGSTDLQNLDSESFHLLPALAARFSNWLEKDPQQAILFGICRRAWSQNQLQRKLLAGTLQVLGAAGIERVAATGPILWGSLYWPEDAIRSIGTVDVLMEPALVQPALEALSAAGWSAPDGIPDTTRRTFYFAPGALIQSPSGGQVRVHWRALAHTDLALRRPKFPSLEALPAGGIAPYAPPVEHSLVAVLDGVHQDGMDWHCDALMICRQARLHWATVADFLRWRSRARDRLNELRECWGANIPLAVTRPAPTRGLERVLASALRIYRRGAFG